MNPNHDDPYPEFFDFARAYRHDPEAALYRVQLVLADPGIASEHVRFLEELARCRAPNRAAPVTAPDPVLEFAVHVLVEGVFAHEQRFRRDARLVDGVARALGSPTAFREVLRQREEIEAHLLAEGDEPPLVADVPTLVSGAAETPTPSLRDFEIRFDPDACALCDRYLGADPSGEPPAPFRAGEVLDRAQKDTRTDLLRLTGAERSPLRDHYLSAMTQVAIRAGETELKAAVTDLATPAVADAVRGAVDRPAPVPAPDWFSAWVGNGAGHLTLAECVEVLRATARVAEEVRPHLAAFFTRDCTQALLDSRYAEGWATLDRLRRNATDGCRPCYRECVRILLGNDTVTEWIARGGPDSGAPPDRAVLHRLLVGRPGTMDSG